MGLNWIDVTTLSFNTLLLLEQAQLSWFPGWLPEKELAIALQANPEVNWYLHNKCPEISPWLDQVLVQSNTQANGEEIRNAEIAVMETINDLLVYVVAPHIYDAQPFLGWDSTELTSLVDFTDKTVVDVGSGTGRLAMVAAETASVVFAVDPVANLRRYLKQKARKQGFGNIFPVDGLVTDLPFPDQYFDVTMGGHVFGDEPEAEYQELTRVTKSGGMIILCPGNSDRDSEAHQFLVSQGCEWSRFEEPEDGLKRKYWKTV